ncbi:MAG: hypothetical protein ACO1SX_04950 [Actinomycetota bacterium]
MRLRFPRPFLVISLLAATLAAPALGAKSARVTVDRKGALRIPIATLKQLGVKPDRDSSIWIEFPPPPAPKPKVSPPLAPAKLQPRLPIRILTPVDKGVAVIGRTRIDGGRYVPGAPGTVYLATGAASTVVLKKP